MKYSALVILFMLFLYMVMMCCGHINTKQTCIQYDKIELLQIRNQSKDIKLTDVDFRSINNLLLNAKKPTKRGVRGGKKNLKQALDFLMHNP